MTKSLDGKLGKPLPLGLRVLGLNRFGVYGVVPHL